MEVGGRWQRYYGFVGRYGLAKVPAEEIELSTPFRGEEDWIALDDRLLVGLEAAPNAGRGISVRKSEDSGCFPPMLFYQVGQPMVFKVGACNRSGHDRPLPLLAEGAEGRCLSTASAYRCNSAIAQRPRRLGTCPQGSGRNPVCSLVGMSWTEVPRKTERTVDREPDLERKLAPAEYVDCLSTQSQPIIRRQPARHLSAVAEVGVRQEWCVAGKGSRVRRERKVRNEFHHRENTHVCERTNKATLREA